MTKRPTDSGLPVRSRGKALADAQAPVVRCTATEGAQQCLAAAHSKMQNHRWGPMGETDQWTAEGIAKPPDGQFEAPRHPSTALEDGAEWPTQPLAVSPPPGDGEAADPPATPNAETAALEPSAGVPAAWGAGSGGGSGRPHRDASEAVLGAAMGVINPVQDAATDPAFQIHHAQESARVLILGQHAGNMFQAIADGQFVANKDLRGAYRKIRQMADFHGIDLDDEGVGS